MRLKVCYSLKAFLHNGFKFCNEFLELNQIGAIMVAFRKNCIWATGGVNSLDLALFYGHYAAEVERVLSNCKGMII